MPGVQNFTFLTIGKESTAGTSVATTREMYPDGSGMLSIDRMRTFHEGANRGTKSNITHATQQGIAVTVPYRSASDVGCSFDDLIIPFSQLDGGQTGAGAGADKAWTFTPTQTGSSATESYTIEVGDDVQAYEVEYCKASRFALSAGRDDLTQLEIDFFGRQATKVTATSVAANNGIKIPGQLWTIKFATAQSGLDGASVSSNFLVNWALDVDTGIRPRWYQDGLLYFGQAVEAQRLGGSLSLSVESTSQAITQFYDKAAADTVDFIRLKATGPTLGSSTYIASMDMAVLYDDVQVIGGVDDGVNLYNVTARLVYDSTFTNAITAALTCSLAAVP